jgi:hypothetical protein
VDADGETLEESIERLRQIEKSLGVAVQQAAAEGYSAELRQLQRDHINAVKALSDAEIRVMRLQQKRGELITVDEAKAMITKTLAPILVELRKLVDQARDDTEKVLLSAIAEHLLAKIRESAAEYVVCAEQAE